MFFVRRRPLPPQAVISTLFCFQKLLQTHNDFEMSLKEKENEYKTIKALSTEVDDICKQNNRESIANPYANVTIEVSARIMHLSVFSRMFIAS